MVRAEEIKPFIKGAKKEIVYYDRYASVFNDWKEDTEEVFRTIIDSDSKYWKLNRFIKDPVDLERCN
jgi:hypothetical protein